MECAALVRAIRQGDLDRLIIPDAPLDILAQQIVAACAAESSTVRVARAPRPRAPEGASEVEDSKAELWANEVTTTVADRMTTAALETRAGRPRHTSQPAEDDGGWDEDELFALVRRAYPYRNLSREITTRFSRCFLRASLAAWALWRLHLSRPGEPSLTARARGSRLAAITSGGAIPETALFTVVAEPEGIVVGTLDEDFAVESNAGDIMLLGNTSWRIRRVEGKSGRVLVEDAHGAPPSVPFWRGEAPARTQELSAQVAGLRKKSATACVPILRSGFAQPARGCRNHRMVEAGVRTRWLRRRAVDRIILQGRAVLGAVPTQTRSSPSAFSTKAAGCS